MTMKIQIIRAWKYARRIHNAFDSNSGGLLAAAIAFYGLLSLIPLLSLAMFVLVLVVGGSALPSVERVVHEMMPSGGELIWSTLGEIKRGTGLAATVGVGGLALSASAIFGNLEVAFNRMWDVERGRAWWRQRLMSLGVMILTVTLMLGSVAVTSTLTWVQNVRVHGMDLQSAGLHPFWEVLADVGSLGLSVLMFAAVYRIVPNCRVRWQSAAVGGLFAGAAWELAKYLFALYVSHFADYNRVYGSLGAIVSLMIWAYYSAVILLLGGEIAADMSERTESK